MLNWFRLYCFHTFFHVFSWTFLPSRSLFCLLPVVSISITFYFLSYILFYLWILPNLYPSFRPSLPRTLSHIVTTLGYFGVLLHRLFLGIIILITFGYYHIDYFWVLPLTQYFANKHIRSKFLFWRFGKFICNFILSISIHCIMLLAQKNI